ncbi:MAG: hypothetical protein KDA87_04285 [Planctomycetales bacterium]|nr:hypothetical protein [Planctomycetales bacterium]
MENMEAKKKRLQELQSEMAELEKEIAGPVETWDSSRGYYTDYHAGSGFFLGMLSAFASLLFNVVGSLIANLPPLRIIQVYLTFPLGERALSDDLDTGMALAIGCCLYLGTGAVLGIPFQMILARFLPKGNLVQRLLLATVLGLLIWGINFYGILSWLQPMLFGGNWLVDPSILPPWVGAATHVVFAWTMAILYPWGAYEPYRRQTEHAVA